MKVKPGDLLVFYSQPQREEINLVLKLTPNENWDFEVWSFAKKRCFHDYFSAVGQEYKKINLKKVLDK